MGREETQLLYKKWTKQTLGVSLYSLPYMKTYICFHQIINFIGAVFELAIETDGEKKSSKNIPNLIEFTKNQEKIL